MFDGQDISQIKGHRLHDLRRRMTIITQDPYASLDPRMTIRDAILEGVQIHNLVKGPQGARRSCLPDDDNGRPQPELC